MNFRQKKTEKNLFHPVQPNLLSSFTLFRNCKERSNAFTPVCDLLILLRDGIAFCPTSFLLLSFRQNASPRRSKVFLVRRFPKTASPYDLLLLFPKTLSFSGALFYFHFIQYQAPSSAVTSPVSSSKTNKKIESNLISRFNLV